MNNRQPMALAVWILVGLLAACWIKDLNPHPSRKSRPTGSKAWIEKTRSHLDWAEQEADKALEEQFTHLDRFFGEAKAGTPQFVDKALGWGSKWTFLLDKVPGSKGGRNSAYLTRAFQDHVFSSPQLEQVTRQMVTGYLDGIEGIENQMLVRIHQDVKDLPNVPLVAVDQAKLQEAFHQALTQSNAAAANHVKGEVAKEIVSLVTAEVLTQVTVKLGVSSGILGAGASSSWATLGIGLVVGVAADQVVSWGWNRLADPKGKLTRHINKKIDDLHQLLLDGDSKTSGLRQQLQRYASERNEIRRQTIYSLGQKGGGK